MSIKSYINLKLFDILLIHVKIYIIINFKIYRNMNYFKMQFNRPSFQLVCKILN